MRGLDSSWEERGGGEKKEGNRKERKRTLICLRLVREERDWGRESRRLKERSNFLRLGISKTDYC